MRKSVVKNLCNHNDTGVGVSTERKITLPTGFIIVSLRAPVCPQQAAHSVVSVEETSFGKSSYLRIMPSQASIRPPSVHTGSFILSLHALD